MLHLLPNFQTNRISHVTNGFDIKIVQEYLSLKTITETLDNLKQQAGLIYANFISPVYIPRSEF